MLANGKNTILDVNSSIFHGNEALDEGGGMYVLGAAEVTVIKTSVTECSSNRNGGGISTRGTQRLQTLRSWPLIYQVIKCTPRLKDVSLKHPYWPYTGTKIKRARFHLVKPGMNTFSENGNDFVRRLLQKGGVSRRTFLGSQYQNGQYGTHTHTHTHTHIDKEKKTSYIYIHKYI